MMLLSNLYEGYVTYTGCFILDVKALLPPVAASKSPGTAEVILRILSHSFPAL